MGGYSHNFSGTSNRFLWDPDGVWQNAAPASRMLILQQEGALAKTTLREYPREQILKSEQNFVAQLHVFNLGDFSSNPDIVLGVQGVLTRAGGYLESRQAHDRLHLNFFYRVHWLGVV